MTLLDKALTTLWVVDCLAAASFVGAVWHNTLAGIDWENFFAFLLLAYVALGVSYALYRFFGWLRRDE